MLTTLLAVSAVYLNLRVKRDINPRMVLNEYQQILQKDYRVDDKKVKLIITERNRLEKVAKPSSEMVARYLAIRAVLAECGIGGNVKTIPKVFRELMPTHELDKWPANARIILDEALVDESIETYPSLLTTIKTLKASHVDTSVLEAFATGTEQLQKRNPEGWIESMISFSERHPKDIVAARRSAYFLQPVLRINKMKKRPLRGDLYQRVLALENRTCKNLSDLLHSRTSRDVGFDKLRETYREVSSK